MKNISEEIMLGETKNTSSSITEKNIPEKKKPLWHRRCPYCETVLKGSEKKLFNLHHCPSCEAILYHGAVPWYRRSGNVSLMLLLSIGAITLLPVCIICVTGDVYTDNYNEYGAIKKWSKYNRWAAVVLLPILTVGLLYLIISNK